MKLSKEEIYFIVENYRIGLLANMPKPLITRMHEWLKDQESKVDKHRQKAKRRYHKQKGKAA